MWQVVWVDPIVGDHLCIACPHVCSSQHPCVCRNSQNTLWLPLERQMVGAAVQELSQYPTDFWGVSALIPVPKPKGQPGVKDDYRGIAVGSVLA